jgi:hypothetical protein
MVHSKKESVTLAGSKIVYGSWLIVHSKKESVTLAGAQSSFLNGSRIKEKLHHQPSTFSFQPSTFNLQLLTFNLQPSTFNHHASNKNSTTLLRYVR